MGGRRGGGKRSIFPKCTFQGSILRIEQSVVLNRGHFDVKQMINVHPQTNTRNQLPYFREQQLALTGNDICRAERDQCAVTRLRLEASDSVYSFIYSPGSLNLCEQYWII